VVILIYQGHTYCKLCLIRYLKEKAICPICRKPILQNKDTLNKNVTLELIIKSKYGQFYDDKLKHNRLLYDEDNSISARSNIPTMTVEGMYVWPKTKKIIKIEDVRYHSTINIASIHDRLIVIVPKTNMTSDDVSNLCEITNIKRSETIVEIEVLGLKRFRIIETNNISETGTPLYVSSGEIIRDLAIDSEELVDSVIEKLKFIDETHNEIFLRSSFSIGKRLETLYGKKPNVPAIDNNLASNLESVTLYYLNVIKDDNKKNFYSKTNIIERVEW
jgi:hypothetical protein